MLGSMPFPQAIWKFLNNYTKKRNWDFYNFLKFSVVKSNSLFSNSQLGEKKSLKVFTLGILSSLIETIKWKQLVVSSFKTTK